MTFGSGRLVVKSTEDQVYETLRQELMQGVEPGTPLRLSAIADRLGVSTMPVRAAIRRLEREGLVQQTARKGAVVAPLDLQVIEEIQRIRWGIEGLAARVGAAAVTDDDLARMGSHLEEVRAAAHVGDPDTYLDAHYAFHDACYAASERPRLLELVRHHRRAAQRYVLYIVAADPSMLDAGPAEALLEAARVRDGALAERVVQERISDVYDRIAARMRSDAARGPRPASTPSPSGGSAA